MGRSRLDLHTDSKVLEDFSSFHSNNRDFISFNNEKIKQKQDNQIISKIQINTDDSLIYEKKFYLEEFWIPQKLFRVENISLFYTH